MRRSAFPPARRWITFESRQLPLLGFAVALFAPRRTRLQPQWVIGIATILFLISYFAVFFILMLPAPRNDVPVLPVADTLIAVGLTRPTWRGELSAPPGPAPALETSRAPRLA